MESQSLVLTLEDKTQIARQWSRSSTYKTPEGHRQGKKDLMSTSHGGIHPNA